MRRLEEKVVQLAGQVASYWELEKLYYDEIAALKGQSAKTTQIRFRDKIEQQGLARPEMTASEANSIRRRYE